MPGVWEWKLDAGLLFCVLPKGPSGQVCAVSTLEKKKVSKS